MDTATKELLRLIEQEKQAALNKLHGGTDVPIGTYEPPTDFSLWLKEKMSTTHYLTETKLTAQGSFLFYSLRDQGVVIDKVTGVYLLRGETTIRRTTFTDINQLVFSLFLIHDTDFKYLPLKQELLYDSQRDQDAVGAYL